MKRRLSVYTVFIMALLFLVFPVRTPFSEETLSPSSFSDSEEHSCPKCSSSEKVISIVYGKPGPSLIKQEEQGKVKLAGCVVGDDDPHFYCTRCKKSW